jgi:hypothetical protein
MIYDSKKPTDPFIINKGMEVTSVEEIERDFPIFFKENKERIESKKIILLTEPMAIEGGLFFDTETHESLFIDYRN